MRTLRVAVFAAVIAAGLGLLQISGARAAAEKQPIAYSIELHATIDPATERWMHKALNEAKDKNATVAIIRIDTPGGLDSSMRSIIKDILAAPMPVIAYVYPNGSRAASAGLYITQSADVAAMAPQTNIGSATPIDSSGKDIGGTLGRKITNDAAAYVRALTSSHGRNADVAEQMVRRATNMTATEALQANLIDVVAANQQELLQKLEGFQVKGPKAQTLHTANLKVVERDMPFQYDLLELLVNPTIAYLLFILELKVGGHAIFGVGGVIALIASGLLLFNTGGAFSIDVPVVIAAAVIVGSLLLWAVSKAAAARDRPVSTGWEEMIGADGRVQVALDPVGQIFTQGALWRAKPSQEGLTIPVGDRVRVDSVEGLTLYVSPAPAEEQSEEKEESPAWG